MLEKLQAIARRLDQVERQLSDPAIYADREMLTRLSREQKELTPIAAAFRAWQQAEDDCAQAQELLTDPEMRELAQEELHRARQERDRLSEELKRLLLPRVRSKTEMDWVEIPALRLLRPGAFGIQEPPADLPAADPAGYAAALALVPCLAASRDGVRLGRGGGYYDRFLAHYKGAGLLLCPEALLLDELPCDDWDARFAPENILTEKGILR